MADPQEQWEQLHARALKRFDAIWNVQQFERRECLEDRRFATIRGAQWDDEWSSQFENAPRLEINKTHKEIVRIFSDYRSNRIGVEFRPDDDATDDKTAESLNGLYRADEQEYDAQEAYDTAFDEGVGGGMGAWRLRAMYEDDSDPDNDYQRICFEPITDADMRVFFDGDSRRQDKKDAKFCFVLNGMSPDAFEEQYPDAIPANFAMLPATTYEWFRPELYTVAEYYEVEQRKSKKVTLSHPVITEPKVLFDPSSETLKGLEVQGWKVERTRIVKRPKIIKYIITGNEVLSEETIAGANIPIIPFYAKRWVIDNIERCAGHTRYAKDPQRAYNAEISQLAEIAGISPFEKPIFDPEQIAGLEADWAEGNVRRAPFALARVLRNEDGSIAQAGQIGTVSPPQVPAALAAMVELAGKDVDDLLGANDQPEQVPANTSAEAIQLVNTRSDAKTFIYLDNFSKAMKRSGEVWLGMAAELYVEEDRTMDALDDQGGRQSVSLHQPAVSSGAQVSLNDFANGKFKVFVDVGPSSQSRKDATVKSLIGMAQATSDQGLQTVLTQVALMNMDGEGIDDVQKWIRMNLIKQGVVQPTDEEKQELAQQMQAAQQQPDPQVELAAAKTADLQASALQRHADAALKIEQAKAVDGGPQVPEPPDGLEQAHKVVQIRKDAAQAQNIETDTAHMPQKLAIEAANARAKLVQAARSNIRGTAA
jgi:hypothetical protein